MISDGPAKMMLKIGASKSYSLGIWTGSSLRHPKVVRWIHVPYICLGLPDYEAYYLKAELRL
jgi:hypothetical protein